MEPAWLVSKLLKTTGQVTQASSASGSEPLVAWTAVLVARLASVCSGERMVVARCYWVNHDGWEFEEGERERVERRERREHCSRSVSGCE